jgi:A/G-specific adenine glycosylase
MAADNDETFFIHGIINWYKKNKRNFPWRIETDPYKILIAEIMLQRTRAEQVLPVYLKFIKQFPNVTSITTADIQQISSHMLSLGLAGRAILIKKMAFSITSDYEGNIPEDHPILLTLPGIGNYIADALNVFAFNKKRTVIDSNVIRIVARFFGINIKGEMRRKRDFITRCQNLSNSIVLESVKDFNWGLLDFGALVCKTKPLCHICPLSEKCKYYLLNNDIATIGE